MQSNWAAFIEDIPEFDVRAGMVHIAMGTLNVVMPVHVFMDGVARAEAAIAKWHLRELELRENNVIPLVRPA